MSLHVTALFNDRLTAHTAVEQLVQAGFSRDVISVVMTESAHDREFAAQSGVRRSPFATTEAGWSLSPTPPGGVLPAIVAELEALSTAADTGDGLLAAGPLADALADLGRIERGALAVLFEEAGMSGDEATLAAARLRDGALLVGVAVSSDRADLARQLLKLAGGEALEAA